MTSPISFPDKGSAPSTPVSTPINKDISPRTRAWADELEGLLMRMTPEQRQTAEEVLRGRAAMATSGEERTSRVARRLFPS